jgi:hypothetical protein
LFREGALERNELFFSNKTSGDIIRKEEFDKMLGSKAHY